MKNLKLLVISGSLIASQAIFSTPAQAISFPDFLNLFKPGATTKVEGWKKECEAKEHCTKVPEPMTILGVGAALASLPAFKKYYGKAKKEEIS